MLYIINNTFNKRLNNLQAKNIKLKKNELCKLNVPDIFTSQSENVIFSRSTENEMSNKIKHFVPHSNLG